MIFLNWFTKSKKEGEDAVDSYQEQPEDTRQFKTFKETYKMITFAMVLNVLYPNPKTDRFRLVMILVFFASIIPIALCVLIDMYFYFLERNFMEIVRHSTIVGPFLGVFLKMLMMYHKKSNAKYLIDEMNRDYAQYNTYDENKRTLIQELVDNSLQYSERWFYCVMLAVSTFPIMATVLNVHSFLFTNEAMKYMVHDVNKPFSEPEERFESPFFEIMYVYTTYCGVIYIVNFAGYDGFFGLIINHACLKLVLFCKRVEEAMKMRNPEDVVKMLVGAILEQNLAYDYIYEIQETFNAWLGLIFLATIVQMCNVMYVITMGQGLDVRYVIYSIAVIIHIYLPCHYASKLKLLSEETATMVYSSGWEAVNDQKVKKMVLFMVARGQVPIELSAFNMITFDMELFVSMMNTSYSMYTLMRS